MIPTSSPRELSSRCGVITPTAAEESETSIDGSGSETLAYSDDDTQEEDEEGEEEEELIKPAPATCDLCGQAPCDWELFGEQIWEECNSMKEEGSDNKAVRYHAYKLYTSLRHGILRCYDRQPLPVCVHGEIMDSWPDPDHVYVGFQSAVRDVVDH
jgi:hypothetical protein